MSNNNTKKSEPELDKNACGEPCEVYSRCCGYFRPVANWNLGKKEEFKDRLTFNVKPSCQCCNKKNG